MFDGLGSFAMGLENGAADVLEAGGSGEGLEDAGAFVVIGVEEGGEVALGEEDGACELIEGESDAQFDGGLGFGDFA